MNCADFERWLDEGMPEHATAPQHAGQCESCGEKLKDAEAMDAALMRGIPSGVTAPADLTAVVMRRVANLESARPRFDISVVRDAFPWWVRAAAEPSVAIALVLCGLVLWQTPALLAAGGAFFAWLSQVEGPPIMSLFTQIDPQNAPIIALAFGIALLPLALWLSYVVYRWLNRAVAHASMPHLHHGLGSR